MKTFQDSIHVGVVLSKSTILFIGTGNQLLFLVLDLRPLSYLEHRLGFMFVYIVCGKGWRGKLAWEMQVLLNLGSVLCCLLYSLVELLALIVWPTLQHLCSSDPLEENFSLKNAIKQKI